jgi:hypothetical protein
VATKAQVRNRAAGLLSRHRLGQAIPSDLTDRLNEAYTSVYEDLKNEQLTIWASAGTIPDAVSPHLAALMAYDATDDIRVSEAAMARILLKVNGNGRDIPSAKSSIRKIVTPKHESMDDVEDF